jgi:hypothetical protein
MEMQHDMGRLRDGVYRRERRDRNRCAEGGRRPASAAKLAGVTRATIYNWKAGNSEFAAAWDDAVAAVSDEMEETIIALGRGGDFQSAAFWLRYHRPETYDRIEMMKLGVFKSALAQAQANGDHRVTLEIGPDGMPRLPAATPEPAVRIYLPDNGRGDGPPGLWPDPHRNGDGGDEGK